MKISLFVSLLKRNILNLVFVLSTLFSLTVHAADKLLAYDWGNQIVHSYFTLNVDGTIEHSEWIDFQLKQIPEKKLSSSELKNVKSLINKSAKGMVTESISIPTEGSQSGILAVRVGNTMKTIDGIHRIDLDNAKEYVNSEELATAKLNKFVKKYVLQKKLK